MEQPAAEPDGHFPPLPEAPGEGRGVGALAPCGGSRRIFRAWAATGWSPDQAETTSGSDLLDELAHEFAERHRRGERPSPEDYADRFPHLADEIRELFPTLAMMERLRTDAGGPQELTAERPRRDGTIPERLGDYRILREIGRGGMGIVYEAVQESLGRHVALKVLAHDPPPNPVALIRFRREAKTAALLHHTNIVPVFGVGEHEGVLYYAMQYIHGRGLDAVLREVAALRREAGRAGTGGREGPDSLPAGLATGLMTGRYPDLSATAAAAAAPALDTRPGRTARGRGRVALDRGGSRARAGPRPTRRSTGVPSRRISARRRGWPGRRPRRWPTRMVTGSSTATSSRPTCSWTCRGRSG